MANREEILNFITENSVQIPENILIDLEKNFQIGETRLMRWIEECFMNKTNLTLNKIFKVSVNFETFPNLSKEEVILLSKLKALAFLFFTDYK